MWWMLTLGERAVNGVSPEYWDWQAAMWRAYIDVMDVNTGRVGREGATPVYTPVQK